MCGKERRKTLIFFILRRHSLGCNITEHHSFAALFYSLYVPIYKKHFYAAWIRFSWCYTMHGIYACIQDLPYLQLYICRVSITSTLTYDLHTCRNYLYLPLFFTSFFLYPRCLPATTVFCCWLWNFLVYSHQRHFYHYDLSFGVLSHATDDTQHSFTPNPWNARPAACENSLLSSAKRQWSFSLKSNRSTYYATRVQRILATFFGLKASTWLTIAV